MKGKPRTVRYVDFPASLQRGHFEPWDNEDENASRAAQDDQTPKVNELATCSCCDKGKQPCTNVVHLTPISGPPPAHGNHCAECYGGFYSTCSGCSHVSLDTPPSDDSEAGITMSGWMCDAASAGQPGSAPEQAKTDAQLTNHDPPWRRTSPSRTTPWRRQWTRGT